MTQLSWIDLTLLISFIAGVNCLRDVRLEVTPDIVQRGGEATLRCHYDLEDMPLYSVKWYRGRYEFYRYAPKEIPTTKNFTVPGINIDLTMSNKDQVTIQNVDFNLTGNFSCEVTADLTFITETDWKKIVVVSLPKGGPVIASERNRYDPGDTLKVNCTAPPSQPPAFLSFTLNNKPIGQTSGMQQRKSNHNGNVGLVGSGTYNDQEQKEQLDGGLQWNELSLILQPFHYVNGQLNLRCIVQIPGIYNVSSEKQLGAGLREPVPERVTSENASTASNLASFTMLCLGVLHPLLR